MTAAADYPTLGFDPAPGDVAAATSATSVVRDAASALGEIARVLHGADDGQWRGQAAIAFRDLLDDEFRPKVDEAHRSFEQAARALDGWVGRMAAGQRRARALEAAAAAAASDADTAAARLAALPDVPPASATPRQVADADQDRHRAATAVDSANDALERVRRDARALQQEYEQDGREVARQLAAAIDIAPNEPGFWNQLADGLADAVDGLTDLAADIVDSLLDLLHEFAPVLQIIGDVASLVSAVCGLLAFIPGLNFLVGPALILGGFALLAHYLAAAGTDGSFIGALTSTDVILDAAGLVVGVGALKVGAKVLAVAKASGAPTRIVPQLAGKAKELPMGYFQLAAKSYPMSQREFAWRAVQYHVTWTGNFLNTVSAESNVKTGRNAVGNNWPPLTNRRPVVAQ